MHLISDKTSVDALTMQQEISGIEKVLKKRSLDVAVITIPSRSSLEKMYLRKITDISDTSTVISDDLYKVSLKSYITENISELSNVCQKETELGLDLSTEFLANKSEHEINLLLNSLDLFNENVTERKSFTKSVDSHIDRNNSSDNVSHEDQKIKKIETIETIKNKRIRRISCLSVATNSFTHKNVKLIQEWATKRGK